MSELTEALRAEAEACRQSAANNGEYNTAFWVLGIVLESLAQRLESASPPPTKSEGER